MYMQEFVGIYDRMDIFEKAFILAGVNELEKGWQLVIRMKNHKKHYLMSIGNNHFIIENQYGKEIKDLGYITSNDELLKKLKFFYKQMKVVEISVV